MISVVSKVALAITPILFARSAVAQDDPMYGPLDDVDVNAYLGRWYQTYASFTVKYTFELGGNCVTADYVLADADGDDTVVAVRNTVRPFGPALPIAVNGFAV